jgi:putative ABC transport system permease protein
MDTFFQDLRFGFRVFLKTPLVALSIIIVLGLGIGANSAMFAILDSLLLHSVRFPDPQSLVFVWSVDSQGSVNDASPADFMDWRTQSRSLSDFSLWIPTSFVFTGGERPRQLSGARVSADFFRTLRIKPRLGRTFLPDEDGLQNPANAAHSVVISYRLWQEDLGGDPNVLGRTIRVDSVPYAIIGVLPPGFQFWWRAHDLWIPASPNIHERDFRDLVVIARLTRPRRQAQTEMDVIAGSLAAAYPKNDKGWNIRVEDFQDRLLNNNFRVRLILLSSAVGLVLLIACSNVAGLLLARSAARRRELAVRVSLGASGLRLARQLFTESAILAIIGGAVGVAISWTLIGAIPKFVPASALPTRSIDMSAPVLWFCFAASALTCILVGLAPSIAAGRAGALAHMKESGRGNTAGRSRQSFRQALIAGEVAVALLLLAGAWLMTASLRSSTQADFGFNPTNVLTFRVVLPGAKYKQEQWPRFFRQALDRIGALPGVAGASLGRTLPVGNNDDFWVTFDVDGSTREPNQRPSVRYSAVDSNYFSTLGIPLRQGRVFAPSDDEKAPLVAIVNEALASRFFPNQNVIGQRILVDRPQRGGQETVRMEIVGVVGNIRTPNASADARFMVYVPFPQGPTRAAWFAVRTSGSPAALASAVRQEIAALDSEQPVEQMGNLEQMLSNQFAEPRFQTGLMGAFALLALALAAIGIYGVNAYAVSQRQNEIGVRMALGASQGAVMRQVIGQGMIPTAIGIALGLAGAAGATAGLKSFLVGTERTDPLAFAGAALLLAAVATIACYIPARRAVRIDPAITLRSE